MKERGEDLVHLLVLTGSSKDLRRPPLDSPLMSDHRSRFYCILLKNKEIDCNLVLAVITVLVFH